MSMAGSNNNRGKMDAPILHEFKKQASFFLKEKIKTARLAFTDVTPAQLLVEEATNGNPGGVDAQTLKMISKAAFEVDDYWRIVGILHKRLVKFDKRNWRGSYKALIVLEYLLTHGPESVAEEFQSERDVVREMERFQHIDEKGFNWGLNVRKKSERILKLLEKGPLLREERDKARKISRGIQGFGSFCIRTSSGQEFPPKAFDRCNSQFIDNTNQDDFLLALNENGSTKTREMPLPPTNSKMEDLSPQSSNIQVNSKENLVPEETGLVREENGGRWNCTVESKIPLLDEQEDEARMNTSTGDHDHHHHHHHHHSFNNAEDLTLISLLSVSEMSSKRVAGRVDIS
ncbi:Clathrin interactor EPSIN 1 [Sesamum alatum]|uniref:Clathrin interactor EPSIN 1 n=1 Tax=Sesamum alatum TaxID=300844 RepID=A0AAE2D0A1_9LAMI|nr:Clathrin interactor EPSIN 1 [Sesamum alatum]